MEYRKIPVYFYPNTKSRGSVEFDTGSGYVNYLLTALGKKWNFVNRQRVSERGIFDLAKYVFKIDILLLNWIENIPDKRYGWFQTLYFLLVLGVLKLLGVKIIWIMHNKGSHVRKNIFLKRAIMRVLLKKSDLVITHSEEGIVYAEKEFGIMRKGLHHIPHPFMREPKNTKESDILYDAIIWGKTWPYKGIDKFLEFLKERNLLTEFRIKIAGTIYPEWYKKLLLSYGNEKISFDDRFIPDNELDEFIARSKSILFTYEGKSTLSSAALMDSLIYINKAIIGPHVGAFADMAKENLIFTYENYDNLVDILRKLKNLNVNEPGRIEYIRANTWDHYAESVFSWLEQKS